jgi:single-stranded DNA-binding protein
MGREICDLMLAVNRRYERSDYIPCIAWGRIASQAALWDLGETVAINGRLQSRTYNKVLEDGTTEERTAYEVSVVDLE